MTNLQTGNYGETLACEFLSSHGFKILERNFRIRGGEIDIVAKDSDEIVFVEVKTRFTHEYGPPEESITPGKINFLIRAAQFYLLKNNQINEKYRIDAVTVDFAESKEKPKIEIFKSITSF